MRGAVARRESQAPREAAIESLIKKAFKRATDPDRAVMAAMGGLIDAAGVRYALDRSQERWSPDKPLKLLLAGYSGTRNTGSDVRVEEMIRQLRVILGDDHVELTALTIDPELSAGYFRTVRQVQLPSVFPKFLFDECPRHHGVVACEGSMFKSKFANALTTMMAGSLGLAAVEGKLSVGYGAEAGDMDEALAAFVRKHCRRSLILCRNEASRDLLEAMGIRTAPGADSAWTFDPGPGARGAELLRRAGWDGKQDVLAVAPINPFWWPAKPDLFKAAARRFAGQFAPEHFKSMYFHSWSQEAEEAYDRYIDALATAVGAFRREHACFVIVVGSEMLDRGACEAVAERMGDDPPLFVADDYDMYELVSVLRECDLLVSSRFHAIVNSMPAGVASIGVTMDERIHNLMHGRGHEHLLLRVDGEGLAEGVITALRRASADREVLAEEIRAYVPTQMRAMGEMGMAFEDEVCRVYPEFPRREVSRSFEHYLPPVSPLHRELLEAHA